MPDLTNAARPATFTVGTVDEHGHAKEVQIAGEHPLTIYVDRQELVTLMTLGAAPEALAIGYLRNQRLVDSIDDIVAVHVDWDVNAVSVKTRGGLVDLEEKTAKRTTTTGCGQGTLFGDLMEDVESVRLPRDKTLTQEALYDLLDRVRLHETIYKQAGAVHGCALASNEPSRAEILMFVEDVGRHNAVDAIAGRMWLEGVEGDDKVFYTTGRLTSEMVIKAAQMRIPFLVSRSGLTQMGYELAQKVGMTMIGRATNRHYLLFTGAERFRAPVAHPATQGAPGPALRDRVTGLVLAGGQGRRMGGIDKGLVELDGRPLVAHVIERLASQVADIVVNANQNAERYAAFGWPVVADAVGGFAGPLAGLQAGLRAATHGLVCTVPCDSPFLPADLVARLGDALAGGRADLAVAKTFAQPHPVFALMRREVLPGLDAFLEAGGRKIDAWYSALRVVEVAFDDEPDAFANINTPGELAAAGGKR